MLRSFGLALAMMTLSAVAQAPLDVRLALVIGNSAYAGAPLPNPVNDAKAMGETLRGLGFGVIDAFKVAGNRMNILVLGACRDNPFGSLASGKGLAQLDAPPGTFLAYATAPG